MRPIAIFVVVSAAAAIGSVLAAPACKGFPDKTCYGDKVNVLADDGGGGASDQCSICMQGTTCCDLVGACGEDSNCASHFKDTQACILREGPLSEPKCKEMLRDPLSHQLYDCMRPKCGDKCGIPSCDLDQAVTLFGSANCDRCIGSNCCQEVNECYKNRSCKLILECITTHCPRTTGTSMTFVGTLPRDAIAAATAGVCGDAAVADFARAFDPGACINRCLDEFAPRTTDAATEDDQTARCLSVGVFACGAIATCGPKCMLEPAATAGPYPEDGLDSGM